MARSCIVTFTAQKLLSFGELKYSIHIFSVIVKPMFCCSQQAQARCCVSFGNRETTRQMRPVLVFTFLPIGHFLARVKSKSQKWAKEVSDVLGRAGRTLLYPTRRDRTLAYCSTIPRECPESSLSDFEKGVEIRKVVSLAHLDGLRIRRFFPGRCTVTRLVRIWVMNYGTHGYHFETSLWKLVSYKNIGVIATAPPRRSQRCMTHYLDPGRVRLLSLTLVWHCEETWGV
jgi:hypothetical protein